MKNLVMIFLFSLVVDDVSGAETDVVEYVSVIEGDSFTLHTDVTEVPDVIVWSFGDVVIARISSESNENKVYVNDKFNDTVKPDNQTGDLKIRKVRITDFGLYKFEINSNRGISAKTFNVSGVNKLVSDGVTIVSVLERDSVILPSGLTEIQRDDQITWKFKGTLIGQLKNQTAEIFADVLDGRFKKRLQLNQQNGSLIITNVRNNTSGPYEVDITKSGSSYTTHKTFRVTIIDGGDRLSVMEGTSVTLESGVSKIHRDDVIIWRCEYGDSVIAKMSFGILATLDGADGRFRGKLKLDYKTGSLTIRDTSTKHTGLYHLDITGNRRTIFKRFNLSVYSQDWSPFVIAVIGVAVLLLVVVVVTCCRNKVSRQVKLDNWRNPEHQLPCEKEEETEQKSMLCSDKCSFMPPQGKVTQISFRQFQEHSYTANCLSQTFSAHINRMNYPTLTEMEDHSGTRRRLLKKVM